MGKLTETEVELRDKYVGQIINGMVSAGTYANEHQIRLAYKQATNMIAERRRITKEEIQQN